MDKPAQYYILDIYILYHVIVMTLLYPFDRTVAFVPDNPHIYIPLVFLLGIPNDEYTTSMLFSFYSFFFLDDESYLLLWVLLFHGDRV